MQDPQSGTIETVVNISVLAEEFGALQYIEINKLAKAQFGNDLIVVVNFVNSGS